MWGRMRGRGGCVMRGVYKMDLKANTQEGKVEIWKVCFGVGLTGVEKIMVFDWGRSEMVVNSCLEHRWSDE